jgi:drug/metabolite transporter, DME family
MLDAGKLFALGTALCFGLNPVLLKMGFARSGSVDYAMILGLVISVVLYAVLIPFGGGLQWELVTPAALVGFIFGGLFGTGIGRRWLYVAIDKIGASPATAIKNSAPLVTTMLAIPLFNEQVGLFQWLAIIGIIGGISLVTWKPGAGVKQLMSVGILAAVGAALSYGVRPLFLKFGLENADLPLTAALVGAIAALLYAVILARPKALRPPPMAPGTFRLFFGAGVLQAFGFLSMTFAIASGDVSIVYPVTSTAPLFTLVFTWLMLKGTEPVTWRLALGVTAVVAGVITL